MKITVLDNIYIPGYGMGPFLTPIEINDPRLIAKIRSQSRIKIVNEVKHSRNKNQYPITIEPVKEEMIIKKADSIKEPVIIKEEDAKIEEVKPEVKEEAPVEEIHEEITAEDLKELNVAELKDKLDEMGVDYLYKDTKAVLIEKILNNLK